MKTTIKCESIPFEIGYKVYPGQPTTSEDQGYGDEVEIIEISLFGEPLSLAQTNDFVGAYGKSYLDEILLWEYENHFVIRKEDLEIEQWKSRNPHMLVSVELPARYAD